MIGPPESSVWKRWKKRLAAWMAGLMVLSHVPPAAATHQLRDSITITIQITDIFPPAAVTDLDAAAGSEGQANISWTSPEEDTGVVPTGLPVQVYELFTTTTSITDWIASGGSTTTWLAFAVQLSTPAPLSAGSPQSQLVNLTPGVTYYFAHRGRDDNGNLSPLDTKAETALQARLFLPDSAPPTPSGLAAVLSATTASVVVTWNDLSAASKGPDFDSYQLYRSSQSGTGFSVVASTTGTSYEDFTVADGTTYYYKISAKDLGAPAFVGPALESALSSEVSIYAAFSEAPSAPVFVSAETAALSSTSITWVWTYSGPPVAGFRLISSTGGALSPDLSASATSYVLAGLQAAQTVSAFVRAFNAIGTTDSSPAVRHTPPNQPVLSITGVTDGSISLSWSANGNSSGAVYELERAPQDTGPWSLRLSTAGLSFTDIVPESSTFSYRLRAVNGGGLATAYDGPVTTATLTIPPGPLGSLAASANTSVGKRIDLAWSNPSDADLAGVLIVRSQIPVSFTPEQFTAYSVGQSVGNGVVVYNSVASPLAFSDTQGLATFTTYYYTAFTRDEVPNYGTAVVVSTIALPAIDSVRPVPPAGFTATRSPDGTQITLAWQRVLINDDAGNTPIEDLTGYEVIRSTVLAGSEELRVLASAAAISYTDSIAPDTTYYYKLRARDFSGNRSEDSPILESIQAPKTFVIRGPALIALQGQAGQKLLAQNNSYGKDIAIQTQSEDQDKSSIVLQSITITAEDAATGSRIQGLTFSPSEFELVFSYESSSFPASAFGVQRAMGIQSTGSSIRSPATFAVYWSNGLEWVNLQGEVNESLKTIAVRQPNLGAFQVRRHVAGSGFAMDSSGVRPRIITPNGDGKNDVVFFYFQNPNNAEVKGKILDINGAFVANVDRAGPVPGITLQWDGRDFNGNVVPMGIYVYRITSEGRSVTGTVVVAR